MYGGVVLAALPDRKLHYITFPCKSTKPSPTHYGDSYIDAHIMATSVQTWTTYIFGSTPAQTHTVYSVEILPVSLITSVLKWTTHCFYNILVQPVGPTPTKIYD